MFTLVHPDLSVSQSPLEGILQQSDKTLLYFYPKNNTPWCTVQATDFVAHSEAFEKLWIQIVGVSRDWETSHCNFIEKHWLKAQYLSDPELILHKQFGTYGEKNNYGKIVQWVIRSTFLLDQNWSLLKEWRNVRAKWHVERVLKELRD